MTLSPDSLMRATRSARSSNSVWNAIDGEAHTVTVQLE